MNNSFVIKLFVGITFFAFSNGSFELPISYDPTTYLARTTQFIAGELTYQDAQQTFWPWQKKQTVVVTKAQTFEIPIRVLIDEEQIKKVNWQLESPEGFIFCHDKTKQTSFTSKVTVTVKTIAGKPAIFLNGKKQPQEILYIKPRTGSAIVKGNQYKGAFAIVLSGQNLLLINHIDLEQYVASVLPHEGWPSWSDEMNKALCIVVRTYGIYKLLEERKMRQKKSIILPYDIRSTNIHQTYKGMKDDAKYSRIATETKGLILSYNGLPILAMFDACCGGVIPARITGIDFEKAPYLKRTYPCLHCQDCKAFKWQVNYSILEVENTLKREYKRLSRLREMRIESVDGGLLVNTVKLRIPAVHEMSGKKFKALFKKLKSRCFTLEKKGQEYIFTGSGLGHHIGLCQWGANTLVKSGWGYLEVLKFYYPGATVMKLKQNKKS